MVRLFSTLDLLTQFFVCLFVCVKFLLRLVEASCFVKFSRTLLPCWCRSAHDGKCLPTEWVVGGESGRFETLMASGQKAEMVLHLM